MIWKSMGPRSLASATMNELLSVGSNCVKAVFGRCRFPYLFLSVCWTVHNPYRLGELAACLCSHFQECLVLFLHCALSIDFILTSASCLKSQSCLVFQKRLLRVENLGRTLRRGLSLKLCYKE